MRAGENELAGQCHGPVQLPQHDMMLQELHVGSTTYTLAKSCQNRSCTLSTMKHNAVL
jgi:hypothetical protein